MAAVTGTPLASADFSFFTALHFAPNGNLIVTNSNPSSSKFGNISQYTTSGTQVGSTFNPLPDFPSNDYTIEDFAVSI